MRQVAHLNIYMKLLEIDDPDSFFAEQDVVLIVIAMAQSVHLLPLALFPVRRLLL